MRGGLNLHTRRLPDVAPAITQEIDAMKHLTFLTLPLVLCACGAEEGPSDSATGFSAQTSRVATADSIRAELAALKADINPKAKAACGASDADLASVATDGSETPKGACYTSLAVDYDSCEETILPEHPQEAHALITCTRALLGDMLACCTKTQPCNEAHAETCYDEVFGSDAGLACLSKWDVLDPYFDRCEEG
jgi:hypothetical protein